MNSSILNDILLKTDKFVPIAKNNLLKDLTLPIGYFVNNIQSKPTPIIYRTCSDCIDDKCIDMCLKLAEMHDKLSTTKNNKTKNNKTKNNKTKNNKQKSIRKTRKKKFQV